MRSLRTGSSALFRAAGFCIALSGLPVGLLVPVASSAQAGVVLEERKLPMRFTWVSCEPNCRGWIGAVGIVTGDTVKDFDEFSKTRDLTDATVVLDSSGGSVNDAITMGRRWRKLGLRTTVGITVDLQSSSGVMKPAVLPQAYCESMCVFLLLAGKTRYIPEDSHVRVHQIWMGDRADDPKAATYSANDLMIVERDIGRLAKYTFDMGGTGDLLSLSLSVPPWDELHRLTEQELKLTNLVTTHNVDDVLPESRAQKTLQEKLEEKLQETPLASLVPKSVQDRFVSMPEDEKTPVASSPVVSSTKSTKTAEATVPTGGVVSAPAAK